MSYVDWIDHGGDTSPSWYTKRDILAACQQPVVIRTYGAVLFEDKDKVILVGEERLDTDLPEPLYRWYTCIHKKLVIGRG